MKKLFCIVLFLLTGVACQVQAGQVTNAPAEYVNTSSQKDNLGFVQACFPFYFTLPGTYSGSVNVSGNLCDLAGNFTYAYQNYQSYPGLMVNGTMNVIMEFDSLTAPGYIKLIYNGGPMNYTFEGTLYEVQYDQAVVTLDLNSMNISAVSGAVIIDGQPVLLDDALANLLIL